MLTRLSVRFPFTLKVALTAMSATGVIVCATGFSAGAGPTLADVSVTAQAPAAPHYSAQTDVSDSLQHTAQLRVAAAAHAQHTAHEAHVQALAEKAAAAAAHAAWLKQQAKLAAEARAAAKARAKLKPAKTYTSSAASAPRKTYTSSAAIGSYPAGVLTASEVGALWLGAGGPAGAEAKAVEIAYCESGFNPRAYNPSGATGIWQILGAVLPGDLTNPSVNAANAVAKYKAAGDSFAPWVCQ